MTAKQLTDAPQQNGASSTAARRRARAWRSVLGAIATIVSIIVAAPPALATFPGENGRIAYRASANQIFLTGSGQLTFPPPGVYDFDPTFSPDGKQVAFIRQSSITNGYFYRLMVVGTDGAGLHQVTTSNTFAPGGVVPFHSIHSPAWLADGQRISLVVTSLGDNSGIWTVGGSEGTIQTVKGYADYVNWSPVENEMVYTCIFRSLMSDRAYITRSPESYANCPSTGRIGLASPWASRSGPQTARRSYSS